MYICAYIYNITLLQFRTPSLSRLPAHVHKLGPQQANSRLSGSTGLVAEVIEYVYVHTCVYAFLYLVMYNIYICIYIYIYIFVYICVHVCICFWGRAESKDLGGYEIGPCIGRYSILGK